MKKISKIIILFFIIINILVLTSCNKTYIILFDYNYDEVMSACEVKKGDKVSLPSNPVREKYEFTGWYEDESLTVKYDFNKEIKSNITIYAGWKAYKLYYITYDLDGGTCNKLVSEFVDGKNVKLNSPSKANYNFIGWYEGDTLVTKLENRNYDLKAIYEPIYEEPQTLRILRVREDYTEYKDVTYKIVAGKELKMDLYLPALEADKYCPILFFFYGGGWIFGSKEDLNFLDQIVDYAIDNNIALVVPNYRLAADAQFPGPVEDCLDCIRYCVMYKDAIGFDVNKMGSIGYSAGGYMALLAGMAHNSFNVNPHLKKYNYNLKYIVDLYGPAIYDESLATELSFEGKFMLTQFLGTTDYLNPKFEQAFASYYLDNNTSNVYIVHGAADPLVPVSQSITLYNELIKRGMNAELHLVEGANHTLGVASGYDHISPSLTEVYDGVCNFISENVK